MIIYVATLKKKITYLQNRSFGDLLRSNTNDPYHGYQHMQWSCKIQFAIQFVFQKVVFVTNNTLQQTSQYSDPEANPSNDVKVETTLQALTGTNLAII